MRTSRESVESEIWVADGTGRLIAFVRIDDANWPGLYVIHWTAPACVSSPTQVTSARQMWSPNSKLLAHAS